MMSYLSMTAATPSRGSPSSTRLSTRTTFPWARTYTSVPWVISAGKVKVISNSEPASTSLSITKYKPLDRNVAGPAVLSPDNLFCGEANTYRECQVIPSSGPAFCHCPHFVTPSVATSLCATPGMILVPTLCATFVCGNTFERLKLSPLSCVQILLYRRFPHNTEFTGRTFKMSRRTAIFPACFRLTPLTRKDSSRLSRLLYFSMRTIPCLRAIVQVLFSCGLSSNGDRTKRR